MADASRAAGVLVVLLVLSAGCLGGGPVADGGSTATQPPASAATTGSAPDGSLAVHYINVGQSVSTLVVGPTGETMLIDTGHYDDDGEHVLAYLRERGVERIDYLVVSHNDADHIGGNAAVIEYFETEADGVGAVYDPGIAASTRTYGEYLDAVEAHDVPLYETRAGDAIPFEGVAVQVMGPPDPYLADGARNENSIVLKLSFGRTSFLLTGDAEDDQEQYLLAEYGDRLEATVLKAGHHGSASSTSGRLLDAVDPEAVVISSAYDSRYGHPSAAVLDRLAGRSIPTYWTATHGNVVLVSDGRGVSVRTQRAAPAAPGSLRDGDPVAPGTEGPVTEQARIGGAPPDDAAPTVATDGGTAAGGGGELAVAAFHADAAGDDRENLNDEYVVFTNDGAEPLDLSGWTVSDEAGRTYTFPAGTVLEPGERVTLYTGSGTDTESDRYWGSGTPVWNNDGDTLTVRNDNGSVVLTDAYG